MNVVFEAPGPGQWALDRSHMPGGCTALVQELMSATEPTAMRRVFAELGAPVETMSVAFVHGHIYTRLRPLIAPDRPSAKSPPKWVLKLVVRVHPEMRRRARTAADVFASAPWNAVIHDWHHGGRAAIVAGNLALQDVPIAQLDDAELMVHLRECWHNCLRNWEQHFWLHGYDLGPLGRFLYAAESWGVPADDLLSLLEGASPSTSGPAREGASIAALVRATGVEPATLDELRSLSTEIDAAVTAYLREREWVLFSRYDFDGLTLGERPDVVLASILASAALDTTAQVQARTQVVRAAVPAKHHTEFDQLLASARDAMDLRDDNGPVTAEWPAGLVRRALLEVGAIGGGGPQRPSRTGDRAAAVGAGRNRCRRASRRQRATSQSGRPRSAAAARRAGGAGVARSRPTVGRAAPCTVADGRCCAGRGPPPRHGRPGRGVRAARRRHRHPLGHGRRTRGGIAGGRSRSPAARRSAGGCLHHTRLQPGAVAGRRHHHRRRWPDEPRRGAGP